MRTFRITHYYSPEPNKTDIFLKSFLKESEIADILVSMTFKFENLVAEDKAIEEIEFIPLLKKFYEDDIKIIGRDEVNNTGLIIKIDLYNARESRCGKRFLELMKNPLLHTKEYEKLIKEIKPAV